MTRYIEGNMDRSQLGFMAISFEDMIGEDNPVRVIDAFVDSLDMKALGFKYSQTKETGRKPYNPGDMLRLYLYGYFNGIRSSRKLARECSRNIEMMWLLGGLKPDFRTISDFRKDSVLLVKGVFKHFSMLCDELELYGKEIIAIDGSKFRACNARKKNYTKGKIQKQLRHFEESARKYLDLLEQCDRNEENEESVKLNRQELQEKIAHAQKRIAELSQLGGQIEAEGEVSLTDPDARHMNVSNNGTDIAHNVQTAVDSKYHLVVAVDVVSSPADQGQLYPMAKLAKEELGVSELTALADKGYYVGEDLKKCEDDQITPIVSRPKPANQGDEGYSKEKFIYVRERDVYICPENRELKGYSGGRYVNTSACRNCPKRDSCTKSKRGRIITRGEYEAIMENVDKRLSDNLDLYKQRQMIVEHPFGTVKRALGYTYFLLRRTEKVIAESHLHFLIYNMKRVMNILGPQKVMAAIMARRLEIPAMTAAVLICFFRPLWPIVALGGR